MSKILPTTPLQQMLIGPIAAKSVGKLGIVIPFSSEEKELNQIDVMEELDLAKDPTDDKNLVQTTLSVGTVGLICALLPNTLTCRFMIATSETSVVVYHVEFSRLTVLNSEKDIDTTKKYQNLFKKLV